MAIAQGDEYEEVDHDAVEELSQTSEEIREEPPGSLRHPPPPILQHWRAADCSTNRPLRSSLSIPLIELSRQEPKNLPGSLF